MKEMLKKYRLPIIITVVLLIAALTVGVVLLVGKLNRVNDRNEMIETLVSHDGEYNKRNIMLTDTSRPEAEALAEKYGAELRMSGNERFAVLQLPEDKTILDVYGDDNNLRDLSKFSVDWHVKLDSVDQEDEEKTDSVYVTSRPRFDVTDDLYDNQTYLDYINIQDVWSVTKGEGITVAVIDTGLDVSHSEFKGRVNEWSYYVTEDKIVKDYLLDENDPTSYDWSIIDDQPWAKGGHGTAVTGVIAAAMDGKGISGIAPEVNILVIKAKADQTGSFVDSSDLILGIYYAIERDADVINMSFGSCGCDVKNSGGFKHVLQLAVDSDVVCVAAAGNCSSSQWCFPAADPNCIGVGALESDGWSLASYSNYGVNTDIVAPGSTLTTCMENSYADTQGTSLSAPIVTGVVALYLSQHKNEYLEYKDVKEVVLAAGRDIGDPGPDFYYGYGCIDASALVLEEKGNVTFNYLTDEIAQTKQVFVRNHTLQAIPEPDRLYAVFDGWYYDDQCIDEIELYSDKFSSDLTLYAKWINEDDGIPYTYDVLSDGTVEIRSYTGHRRFITIPEYIDGKPVSSVGAAAFMGNTRLKQINLPKRLTQIKESAFRGCTSLVGMTIPDNVLFIGSDAFTDDINLKYVSISADSELFYISSKAFKNCVNLQNFYIPKNVSYVSGSSFFGCTSMLSYDVDTDNKVLRSDEGVIFSSAKLLLVAYPAGRAGEYSIPEMTRAIDNSAFAYSKITRIELSNINSIGVSAFYYSALTSIDIPDSVVFMDKMAFANSSLSSIKLGHGLTSISEDCFNMSSSIVDELIIPNTIEIINSRSFYGLGISNLIFEENSNLTYIGKMAFMKNPLSELDMPDKVSFIGDSAFSSCSNLYAVRFSENSDLTSIGIKAFCSDVMLKHIDLPKTVIKIDDFAFAFTGLEGDVTVPASVNEFGAGVFGACSALENIKIANGNTILKDIDGVVFSLDEKTIIEYPAGKKYEEYSIPEGVTTIDRDAFFSACILKYINLPESLIHIGKEAFCDCIGLTSVTIPNNVVTIGNASFCGTVNLEFVYFCDNPKLSNISFSAFANSGIREFIVPSSVTRIAAGAFSGCQSLIHVTFEANSKLDRIPAEVFSDCRNLYSIRFENGSSLTTIQAHAFDGLASLHDIDFGDAALTEIGNFAFKSCTGLEIINMPEGLLRIGRYAFYGCEGLREVRIPSSVMFIGRYAFLETKDCTAYFSLNSLPETLQEDWDRGLVGYATGVSEVYYSDEWEYAVLSDNTVALLKYKGTAAELDLTNTGLGNVSQISGECFVGAQIENVILPDTLKIIQRKAFFSTPLKSVTIPASVTFIGNNAFAHTLISSLTFAENSRINSIEYSAFEKTKDLKSVRIPKSLESMGRNVFMGSSLETLTFEENTNLTEIPAGAFAGTDLKQVVIPEGVTYICSGAFRDIKELESVQFPKNDEIRLESYAFYDCGLKTVDIPENMVYIGEYAFISLYDLNAYNVAENNPYYKSVDGVLFHKLSNKLIAFPAGKTGSYTVPAYTESIGFGAFESSALTEVLFEDGINLLTIGCRAFMKADKIKQITIPSTVVSIDYYAFAYADSLEKVIIGEDNKMTGIYEGAFYGCTSLTDIMLPDTVVEISDYAFCNCRSLVRLPVSENSGLLGIYGYAMAYTGLTGELVLPDGLQDIGERAFAFTNITKAVVPDKNAEIMEIGLGVFESCDDMIEISLPFIGAYFNTINDRSWFGYIFGASSPGYSDVFIPTSLNQVHITGNITAIGNDAFAYINSYFINRELYLPDTVDSVYGGAFNNEAFRYELKNPVTIYNSMEEDGQKLVSEYLSYSTFGGGIYGKLTINPGVKYVVNAFNYTYLNEIVFPEGVIEIKGEAYQNYQPIESALIKVSIPSTVTVITPYAFNNNAGMEEFVIADGNMNYYVENGILYEKEPFKLICSFPKMIKGELVLSNDLTELSERAFADCTMLKKAVLPSNITSVSNEMFKNCTSLEEVVLPDGIISIGNGAFRDCVSLKKITIPDGVINIGASAFTHNTSLSSINIPDSVETIGARAFEYTSLTSVTIPDNVEYIGEGAFDNCTDLKTVSLGEGITEIPEYTFSYCTNLENLTLNDNITAIGFRAFDHCLKLETMILPQSVKRIGGCAFDHCISLKDLHLNEGLVTIEGSSFGACWRLTEVTLPSTLLSIEGYPFPDCSELYKVTNLSDLVITREGNEFGFGYTPVLVDKNGNISYFYEDTFIVDDANGFRYQYTNGKYMVIDYLGDEETIRLPDNFEGNEIGVYFYSNNVNTVIIPGTLYETGICSQNGKTGIGIWSSLKNVILEDGIVEISDGAFNNNKDLVSIDIPDSVEVIGRDAFSDCTGLKEIHIGKNVKTIGGNAFNRCDSLKNFTIDPENPYIYCQDGVLYNADKTEILTVLPNLLPENLVLPDTLTEVPGDLFNGSDIKELVISEGVTYIGYNAFGGCEKLEKISLPSTLEKIDFFAFCGCAIKEIELPDNLKRVERREFRGCRQLETIKIGKNTEFIDTSAFSDCPSIKEVFISPQNTHLIYDDGFFYSFDRTRITGAIPTKIGSVVVIADTVRDMPINMFVETDITEIVLPDKLESISKPENYGLFDLYYFTGDNMFYYCVSLKKISLDEDNTHFKVIDNVLYDNPVTKILSVAKAAKGVVNIPAGVTEIPYRMFNECGGITKVVIPDGVTSIAVSAFSRCPSLYEIIIPDSVTEIGYEAFFETGLKSVRLPSGLTAVQPHTFESSRNLTSVKFNDGLTEIGEYAFSGCYCMTDPILPDSLTRIGSNAFAECRAITKVILPAGLTYLGSNAFYICEGNEFYELINKSDIDLFSGVDYGLYNLRVVIDKNGNKTYADGWEGFEFIDTADGFRFYKEDGKNILVAYVGDEDDITLPNSFYGETYELYRFRGGLRVTIDGGVEELSSYAISQSTGTEEFIFASGVRISDAGNGCVNVRSVIFGDDIEFLGMNSFCGCSRLTNIVVPDKKIIIDSGAFNGTAYSNDPKNLTDGAFYVGRHLVCVGYNVEYLEIRPDTLTISESAFNGVPYLKKVYNKYGSAPSAEILVLYDMDIEYDFGFGVNTRDALKAIVISENSRVMDENAFGLFNDINIFVEKQEKDCRWDEVYPGWNNGNKVYYGDEWNWATFRTADGECVLSVPVKNAEVLRIPPLDDYVKGEYTDRLIGWDIDGDGICDSVPAVIYDDLTAVAVRELKKSEFTIRFFDDDRRTVIYEYVSGYGESLILPPDPVRRGYTFAGWIGGGFYNPISENMVYFAEWKHDGDGHEYTISRVEPTCTEQGYDLHVCSICGESYKTDFTEPTGHTYGEWIADRAATCTVVGLRHRECACGRVEEETINTTPHDFTAITTKQPTCSETGIISYKCNDCGFETTDVIPVSPHSYDKKYITEEFYGQLKSLSANVICISDKEGLFCYECSVCHRLAEEDEEDDLYSYSMKAQSIGCSHVSGMWKSEKEPTDSDPGTNVLRCSKCGDVLDIKLITEKGHTYNNAPAWSWSDDHLSAKALFACATCDDVLEIDADVSAVSDNISTVYTATVKFNGKTYTSDEITVYIEYTVKFVDYDDTVISENTYHYGDNVTVPNDPVRAEDETYTYTFAGWDKEIKTVTENVTYTATYDKKEKEQPQFMLGDINGDGKTNNKDVVALFRYVSSGNGNVVIAALDTNGDGKLNNKDVVTLFRYVSNNNNPISTKPYDPNAKVIITAIIPDRTKVH